MDWEKLNLNILERLRARFLGQDGGSGNYWRGWDDLENYDFVYARRIGWKWDAVLADLKRLGWTPPPGVLLDWGCGTGIASRGIVGAFGASAFREVRMHDRSGLAMRFAVESTRRVAGRTKVSQADSETLSGKKPFGMLALSHVINELDQDALDSVISLCRRAKSIIWVEPGSLEDSHRLVEVREKLRDEFRVIAPCLHQNRCEMTLRGNERHWCHFFAEPPKGIRGDEHWRKLAKELGIDLRSLPYSHLVLEHRKVKTRPRADTAGLTRVIGRPRVYKPLVKLFCCDPSGLEDREAQKRDLPDFYRDCRKGETDTLYNLEMGDGRIQSVKKWESPESGPTEGGSDET